MYNNLLALPSVKAFLKQYPKTQWQLCIESCLVIGIRSINKKYPVGISLDNLSSLAGIENRASRIKQLGIRSADVSPKDRRYKRVESKIKKEVGRDIAAFKADKHRGKKAARSPVDLKEPILCSVDVACTRFLRTPPPRNRIANEALRIADNFLSNPFTTQLVSTETFTSPRSPSYKNVLSPKFFSRLKMFRAPR